MDGSMVTPVKPPSIMIPRDGKSQAAAAGLRANVGVPGATPKEVKEMILTPADIRRANTFKKRRRPRSERKAPRNRNGWRQRTPPPAEEARPEPGPGVLARSHAQAEARAAALLDSEGLSARAAGILQLCLRAAGAALAGAAADAATTPAGREDRARRYELAAQQAQAQAQAQQAQVQMQVEEDEVVLTKEGEAVLPGVSGAIPMSGEELDELNAMQGLMISRHSASQWQVSPRTPHLHC